MEEVCLGLAIDVEAGICRDYYDREGLWVLWKASVAQNRTEPSRSLCIREWAFQPQLTCNNTGAHSCLVKAAKVYRRDSHVNIYDNV